MSKTTKRVLVVAEMEQNRFSSSTLRALGAAKQLGAVFAITAGTAEEWQQFSPMLQQLPAQKIYAVTVQNPLHGLPEPWTDLVLHLIEMHGPFDYILAPASGLGKKMLPRLAALLGVEMISNVISIHGVDEFIHPIYAGNALEHVKVKAHPVVLTIRPMHFQESPMNEKPDIEPYDWSDVALFSPTKWQRLHQKSSKRPALNYARVVVSGGRGLQKGENFKLLEELADVLGAAIGASRAAVDAGFVTNEYQVGQTGQIVAPDLYIAIGISGAIQHVAGMKDSRIIVAINQDPQAPIFDVADYGLVGDLFELVPALTRALQAHKK